MHNGLGWHARVKYVPEEDAGALCTPIQTGEHMPWAAVVRFVQGLAEPLRITCRKGRQEICCWKETISNGSQGLRLKEQLFTLARLRILT